MMPQTYQIGMAILIGLASVRLAPAEALKQGDEIKNSLGMRMGQQLSIAR